MSSAKKKEQLFLIGFGLEKEHWYEDGFKNKKYPYISIENIPSSSKLPESIAFGKYSALILHTNNNLKKSYMILDHIRKTDKQLPFIIFTDSADKEKIDPFYDLEPSHLIQTDNDKKYQNTDAIIKTIIEIISGDQKKQSESFSETSSDRYKNLVEHLPVGVYRTTPDGKIIEANRYLAEMLGFSDAKQLLNTNVTDLYIIKSDRQEHLTNLNDVSTLFAEHELRNKNGESIWVRDFPRAIKDINGNIKYYDGILLEITDRRRAEERLESQNEELEAKIRQRTREQIEANEKLLLEVEQRKKIEAALRESEKRFKGITERSFDAILEIDMEARMKYVSPAFIKIFGYKPKEVIGSHFSMLFADPHNPKLRQGIRLIVAGKNLRGLQIQGIKKDGSQIEVELNVLPIIVDGEVIGANGNIRDITERKKSERALRRQIDELIVLHDVSKVCVEANDPDKLIYAVTEIISRNLYNTNFGFVLLENNNKTLVSHKSYRPINRKDKTGGIMQVGKGITGTVAMTGKPIRTGDVREDPLYVQADEKIRSELCVPLKVGNRILGVINTESDRLNAFSSDDERLLMTIAGQIAPALERLRAEQSLVRQVKELKVLHAVAIACVEATDQKKLLSRITEIIVETIYPINFSIWLLDGKEDISISNSFYKNEEGRCIIRQKITEGIIGSTVATGQPILADDVSKFRGYIVGDPRTKSELCVPLKIGTRVIGAINMEHEKIAAFTKDDERLLITIAGQLAPSIERLRAEQSLIRQLKELKVLHTVATACVEATNPKELMNRVGKIVVDSIYTSNFSILLLDEHKKTLATEASYYYSGHKSDVIINIGTGITGKVARTGLPMRVDDVSQFPEYLMTNAESRSELCVPLKIGNKVIGVINVESERLNAFSEDDERLLMTIAFQLGLGLDGLYKEEQFKNEKELFHNYLDIAGVMLIAMDEKLNITMINRKGCQILSRDPNELIGKNWIESCVPVKMQDMERATFDTMLATDITYHPVENFVLTGDNNERMIAWNRSVLKNEEGRITGFLSSGEDITVKKELEERLRKSEEEYRTLVENIRIGVYRSKPDLDGEITKVNPAAADILGFSSPDKLLQRKLIEFHCDIQNRKYSLNQIKMTGFVKNLEIEMKKNDGNKIWCSLTANGQFNEKGDLLWIDSVLENITDKKESREALMAEKERLAVTLRAIGDGVISVDVDGRVILMNNVASKLTGWVESDAIDRLITEVVDLRDPSTNGKYNYPLNAILKENSFLDFERNLNLVSKSGNVRIVSYNGAPIRDKYSNTIGAVMVFRDVTEKTKLEEELLKAQKIESIGFLAGGIAHDFNNILAAVLGNISLARIHCQGGEKSHKYLTESEKAIDRAKNLTTQLLTFSKGGDPIKKPISIKNLLTESVSFSITGSNVKARFHIDDDLHNVKVDKDQINQVISNIIVNSIQAMPQGGAIEVYGRNVKSGEEKIVSLPKRDYILIKIKDSGIGIPEENLTKIFDPYFTTKQTGTGLGLAISYSIIKKHDGFIRVESKTGQGTTFYIYLPAFRGRVSLEDQKQINIESGYGRILYMDDDNSINDTVRELLTHIGYSVVVVNDGNKAIELYKKAMAANEKFDLVILDLTVPGGMGGKETLTKLLKTDPHVVAIATSGYSNDPIMSDYTAYGFTDTIAKPFRIQEIAEVIKRNLPVRSRHKSDYR